jgi:hypothetical protein
LDASRALKCLDAPAILDVNVVLIIGVFGVVHATVAATMNGNSTAI